MKIGSLASVLAGGLLALVGLAAAAADRPYTEGPVSVVTSIRTEPGMFDAYMQYLSTTYKQIMEENKKAGNVVDYAVYQATPRTPDDPDVYLVVTYKNMAALDGLTDRTDVIASKVFGSREASNQKMAERGKMRTMVGSEMIRQLILK